MARLCPHCDTNSNFSQLAQFLGNWGTANPVTLVRIEGWTCQHCGGAITVFHKYLVNGQWVEFLSYPVAIPKVDISIPQKVAEDFISGVNCFSIGEYKAAATMFRRSLQQIMIDKNAKGDTLSQQIKDLAQNNIITLDLQNWADEIRYWGNEGAHPATDHLDELSAEEVEEVKTFLEGMFEYIYVMPAKVEASRLNRTSRKNTP